MPTRSTPVCRTVPSTPLRAAAGAGRASAEAGAPAAGAGVAVWVEPAPGMRNGKPVAIGVAGVRQHGDADEKQQQLAGAGQPHAALRSIWCHVILSFNAVRARRASQAVLPLTFAITALAVSAPDCAAPFM